MSNKYPNPETPYRFRRKRPHRACTDRLGVAKATWKSESEANKHKIPGQEAYQCPTGHGFHIRTKR